MLSLSSRFCHPIQPDESLVLRPKREFVSTKLDVVLGVFIATIGTLVLVGVLPSVGTVGGDIALLAAGGGYLLLTIAIQSCSKKHPSLEEAAKQGDSLAQFRLGACYAYGLDVDLSWEEAAKWYTQAAIQRHPIAQFYLGNCYEKGLGVVQSDEEAVKWYTEAAMQGHSGAQYNLGVFYAMGRGIRQSFEEAAKWFKIAAKKGNSDAQYNLGLSYAYGKGVKLSPEKARFWFNKAAVRGNSETQSMIDVENGLA